jgi:O-antigen/teichoic acid export membrane protein
MSYKLFAQRVGLVGVTNLILSLRGLILIPILTKTLGAASYGIWSQIWATISLLAPLCTLGLSYAIIRFLSTEKDKGTIGKGLSSIFAITAAIAFTASSLMLILSGRLAVAVFGGIDAAFYIKISAFLILLVAIDQLLIGYFMAFQQMKRYSSFLILQTVGEVILIAYLVLSGFGLSGAIISLFIVRLISSALGFLWITSDVKFLTPDFSIVKSYLPYTLPLLPTGLCYWFINLGDRYVIGYFMGVDAVGIYSVSYSLGGLLALFYAPLGIALFPAMVHCYENDKIQELKMHLKYSLKFFLMFAIPAFFGLSVLSKSLLVTLATSEFVEGGLVVSIVALATLLYYCGSINTHVLNLFKEMEKIAIIHIGSASINIVMNILLVPLMGIVGAAIATLVTFAIYLFVICVISFKKMPYDVNFTFILKSFVSSVPMAFVVWKLNPMGAVDILIAIGIAAAIYFGILILLRGFTKEEYGFLRGFLRFGQ